MIDGIKISYPLPDFAKWRQHAESIGIVLRTGIDTSTGDLEVKTTCGENGTIIHETETHKGEWRGYRLEVKDVTRKNKTTACYLTIDGSLHESHHRGSNYAPFTFGDCCREINTLCRELEIIPERAKIKRLEFGVNIPVSFQPFPFLRSHLISYKGDTFSRYKKDKRGISIGYFCDIEEYEVKIYDKGLEYGLNAPLMRFELKYTRLRQLRKETGIYSLHDLLNPDILPGMFKLLSTAWNNVLLYDEGIKNAPVLTKVQRQIIDNADNPNYWQRLKDRGGRKHDRYRRDYRELTARYGIGYHSDINRLISDIWHNLAQDKGAAITQHKQKQQIKTCTNIPIMIKGENGTLPSQPPRYCKTCGKDISHQSPGSIFCSAKYVGEEQAKRCRNMDSNPRNSIKRKVEVIQSRGVLFDIVPYLIPGKLELINSSRPLV